MRASEVRDEARRYKQELLGRMFAAAPTADAGTVLGQVLPRGSNILGVGYGAKMVGSTSIEELAVRVYVRAKRAATHLRADERIPDQVNGRPTDVIAVDDLSALARPVRCGVSVGHIDITAGTLGAVVERGGGDEERYLLSNNHVLANSNEAEVGDPILEPGPVDGKFGPATLASVEVFQQDIGMKIDGRRLDVNGPGLVASVDAPSELQTCH
jgi:hypothetical protein